MQYFFEQLSICHNDNSGEGALKFAIGEGTLKISSTLSAVGTGTGVTPGPEVIESDEEKALIRSAQVKATEDRIRQEREAASQLLVTSTIAAIVSFGMQGAGQGAMSAASTVTAAAATSTGVTPESGFAKVTTMALTLAEVTVKTPISQASEPTPTTATSQDPTSGFQKLADSIMQQRFATVNQLDQVKLQNALNRDTFVTFNSSNIRSKFDDLAQTLVGNFRD